MASTDTERQSPSATTADSQPDFESMSRLVAQAKACFDRSDIEGYQATVYMLSVVMKDAQQIGLEALTKKWRDES